ncbi:MAG: aminoacyl-tRNA hydrolase [archaeon]
MARGKTASQAAHASVEAMDKTNSVHSDWVREWKEKGMEKVVLKVSSFRELMDVFQRAKKALPTILIRDAGRTQIKQGSITCIAIGPAPEKEIDEFTGNLKLL